MAIEDALVLATLLAEYWDKPDGHVEAFYLYEVSQVSTVEKYGVRSRRLLRSWPSCAMERGYSSTWTPRYS